MTQILTAAEFQALPKARGGRRAHTSNEMNGTERSYSQRLEERRYAKDVAWFAFQALKFRLADNTFYTPDFIVMLHDGSLEAHEVKGFWEDDARVKIKVAAELFPVQFVGVTVKKKRDGGGWEYERF